jgi:hypothetical protein
MKYLGFFSLSAYTFILLNLCYGSGSENFKKSLVITSMAKGEMYGGKHDDPWSDLNLGLDAIKFCISPFEVFTRAQTGGFVNKYGISETYPQTVIPESNDHKTIDPWTGKEFILYPERKQPVLTKEEEDAAIQKDYESAVREIKRRENEEKANSTR